MIGLMDIYVIVNNTGDGKTTLDINSNPYLIGSNVGSVSVGELVKVYYLNYQNLGTSFISYRTKEEIKRGYIDTKYLSASYATDPITSIPRPSSASSHIMEYGNLANFNESDILKSGEGRDLICYKLGKDPSQASNLMILNFAIHGHEDSFPQDGIELTKLANNLVTFYANEGEAMLLDKDWTLIIIPVANPDGLLYQECGPGYNCNLSGRRTVKSTVPNTPDIGIDLNRCFPCSNFKKYEIGRNYNGDQPLRANEAVALDKMLSYYASTNFHFNHKVFCDAHGWLNQIICINGSTLETFFNNEFPNLLPPDHNLASKRGFISRRAHDLSYDACLFEFPANVRHQGELVERGYADAFRRVIENIINNYNG